MTDIKKKERFFVYFGDIFGDIFVPYVYFGVQTYIYFLILESLSSAVILPYIKTKIYCT